MNKVPSWAQLVISAAISAGIFVGLSQSHITLAEAIHCAREEIRQLAFPLPDGVALKKDIEYIRATVEDNKVYLRYLAGVIDKNELTQGLSENSRKNGNCVTSR